MSNVDNVSQVPSSKLKNQPNVSSQKRLLGELEASTRRNTTQADKTTRHGETFQNSIFNENRSVVGKSGSLEVVVRNSIEG